MPKADPFAQLDAIADDGSVNVVIDTPKDSRNKYKFDENLGLYKLGHVLPAGTRFPHNFGFIPGTRAEDGDPVDVLVLMEDPTFVGCIVPSRLIGVIEAQQTQEGKTFRNDRLIAVAAESRDHRRVRSLADIGDGLVEEIEHFFVSYNVMRGRQFEPRRRGGPKRALNLVRASLAHEKKPSPERKPPRRASGGARGA